MQVEVFGHILRTVWLGYPLWRPCPPECAAAGISGSSGKPRRKVPELYTADGCSSGVPQTSPVL